MLKIIKKYGDSLVIRLNPDEIKIYGLKEGSIIDFQINNTKEIEEDEN